MLKWPLFPAFDDFNIRRKRSEECATIALLSILTEQRLDASIVAAHVSLETPRWRRFSRHSATTETNGPLDS